MYFNSLSYFVFMPVVLLLYATVSDRQRWLLLLIASYIFYGALQAPYLPVILLSVTAITYITALLMERNITAQTRNRLFWTGVAANLAILFGMRYLPWLLPQHLTLFITVGVSYYVLQTISYLSDLKLQLYPAERHAGYFALYLSFFPKLIQGPIERAGDLLPQLKQPYQFSYENIRSGLLLFVWGLFKKVVVANRLEIYVNEVYGNLHDYGGLSLVIATYLYAFQLYCDFSGYTHMAIGSARCFNISLTENFRNPYAATSIADFWRRWHISLSSWLQDYIFKPLQMEWRNLRNTGTALALLATFCVSGLWHGTSWCFAIWGALHGILLACSVFWKPIRKSIVNRFGLATSSIIGIWKVFFTFNLVCFTWIFFRSPTLSDALYITTHLADESKGLEKLVLLNDKTGLVLVLASLMAVLVLERGVIAQTLEERLFRSPLLYRWAAYYAMLLIIILFSVESGKSFIYARF